MMILTAMDYTAPTVPDSAAGLVPVDDVSFGRDLWKVVTAAVGALEPDIVACGLVCLSLFAVVMLISLLKAVPGKGTAAAELAGVLAVGCIMLQRTGTQISLATDTINQISEYGRLLLPVMTAALASQGGAATSAALYAGTAVFDSLLSDLIAKALVPMVYLFLALSVAASATGERMLGSLRGSLQWLMNWCLRMVLYIFTGYMGITGVVSGSADAAALKATRLTMTGMIPVVGGILADASESVIVGAGVMKSAVGVYGMLALIVIGIAPFLRIGTMYLMLKLTAALCDIFDVKPVNDLIKSFSGAMGLLLGMTGTVCVMQLISTVCFMKGVA